MLDHAIQAAGFARCVYVPCSRIEEAGALQLPGLIICSREDEAIAIACGAFAAGSNPLVLMQSSGYLSALNAISSLAVAYNLHIDLFVSMRGENTEHNFTQKPGVELVASTATQLGFQVVHLEPDHFTTNKAHTIFVRGAVTTGRVFVWHQQ